MAASVPGHQCCRHFYITDRANGLHFLMDTGAEVSAIAPLATDHNHHKGNFSLQATNNTQIATHYSFLLTLNIGLHHTFRLVFMLKAPSLLSTSYVCHYSILVDLAYN